MAGDRDRPNRPLDADALTPDMSAATPPPQRNARATAFAGLLFLGSLGAVAVGIVYTLIRQIRRKKRSEEGQL